MDVTLVLTHRCNLGCGYCYAGEHYKRDMDPETLDAAVELLFADGADDVQLGFFGGEPLLAFPAMRHAVGRARRRAAAEGRQLSVQCTTNGAAIDEEHAAFFAETGAAVTVSIDGVAEAHDLNRPRAGGGSSFGQVYRGLRLLLDAGLEPDAMMVITPETAPHAYRSVSWLWTEGVDTVRANLELAAPWGQQERDELREQLTSIGVELCARRSRGEPVRFVPFERGMKSARAQSRPRRRKRRQQIVVGTSGNLYPCAPMVGEDRDGGPEVALRLGHIADGREALKAKLASRGAGCSDGGACACAAYLETGDRDQAGPVGLWYARLCREIGGAVAANIHRQRAATSGGPSGRRLFMIGMAAAASSVALAVPMMLREESSCSRPPSTRGDRDVVTAGATAAPEPEPEPEPIDIQPDGAIAQPPEPMVPGQMIAQPEPEPEPVEVKTKGELGEPVVLGDLQ